MKKTKQTDYEKMLIEITSTIGIGFESKKITYWEAIGALEAAKHLFMEVVEEKFERNGDKKNDN
jgi:hypothetical protein